MKCNNCGFNAPDYMLFCPSCGQNLAQNNNANIDDDPKTQLADFSNQYGSDKSNSRNTQYPEPYVAPTTMLTPQDAPKPEPYVAPTTMLTPQDAPKPEPYVAPTTMLTPQDAPKPEPYVAHTTMLTPQDAPKPEPYVAPTTVLTPQDAPKPEPYVAPTTVLTPQDAPKPEPYVAHTTMLTPQDAPKPEPYVAPTTMLTPQDAPTAPVASQTQPYPETPAPVTPAQNQAMPQQPYSSYQNMPQYQQPSYAPQNPSAPNIVTITFNEFAKRIKGLFSKNILQTIKDSVGDKSYTWVVFYIINVIVSMFAIPACINAYFSFSVNFGYFKFTLSDYLADIGLSFSNMMLFGLATSVLLFPAIALGVWVVMGVIHKKEVNYINALNMVGICSVAVSAVSLINIVLSFLLPVISMGLAIASVFAFFALLGECVCHNSKCDVPVTSYIIMLAALAVLCVLIIFGVLANSTSSPEDFVKYFFGILHFSLN